MPLASSEARSSSCRFSLLRDERLDFRRERREVVAAGRVLDLAVAALPQAGAVHADDEAGVRIDVGHPVERPLVARELPVGHRDAEEGIRLARLGIRQRPCLVLEPPVVVIRRGAHDRVVRRRRREVGVPPVRGELSDEPGMIGLADERERPGGTLADDHDALLADSGECTRRPRGVTGWPRTPRSGR